MPPSKPARDFVRLHRHETTLEEKMVEIDDILQRYHVREGLVGDIHLHQPGRLDAGHRQQTADNDGLWTSYYVAAEAFRYAVTGDAHAKQNARRSLEALMFLERITGIPGFVARSIIPIDDDSHKYGGEWHRSADGKWWWKGDTSSDELDGHYFAYAIYYNVAADESEKKEIAAYVVRITDHILDHGYYFVGPSGKPTTWGVWSPEKLNHDLQWIGDRGLNSLEILSHLKVAEQLTGNPRYTAAANELISRHSYHINTVLQKHTWPPECVNHSDDELAFTAYYPLVILERDPSLRASTWPASAAPGSSNGLNIAPSSISFTPPVCRPISGRPRINAPMPRWSIRPNTIGPNASSGSGTSRRTRSCGP